MNGNNFRPSLTARERRVWGAILTFPAEYLSEVNITRQSRGNFTLMIFALVTQMAESGPERWMAEESLHVNISD
jgi:hypothetical protein